MALSSKSHIVFLTLPEAAIFASVTLDLPYEMRHPYPVICYFFNARSALLTSNAGKVLRLRMLKQDKLVLVLNPFIHHPQRAIHSVSDRNFHVIQSCA
jgi:hypothetical protein